MTTHDEHEDDLEAEVNDGAEIETERYEPEDEDDASAGTDVTHEPDRDEQRENEPGDEI